MVDSVQIWPPGLRLTDALGAVLPGGQVRFFEAGTTTPKEMFSDKNLSVSLGSIIYTRSDGLPVASEGSTSTVTVYTGTADYKYDVLDADDATVVPVKDNVQGALNTSSFLTADDTSTFSLSVIARATNLTVTTTHRGKLINCNATGGDFTLTIDNAATLGDNWAVFLANAGASGEVLVSFTEALAIAGTTVTRYVLQPGELLAFTCDGTAFKAVAHRPPLMGSRGPGVITIADRVSSAPVSPEPGARYIVTGAFSGHAVHDVIEYNGSDFTRYTPPTDCGWVAYVQDEDRFYSFQGSAWVSEEATDSRPGTIQKSTRSVLEAATDDDSAVLPSLQHFHPGHPKFCCNVQVSGGTPTLQVGGSYNVLSITDGGTGVLTVTIDDDFANAVWICQALVSIASLTGEAILAVTAQSAGAVTLGFCQDNNTATDPTAWHVSGLGASA